MVKKKFLLAIFLPWWLVENQLHKQVRRDCATPFRNNAFRIKTVLSCLSFFASLDLTITVPSGSTTNKILCRM